MRTKPLYSNCHFGLAYLLLRGGWSEVAFAPGDHWPYLPHAGVITRRRHYISFYRLLPHEQNAFAPWWFLGSFRGVRRSKWVALLARRGRIRRIAPAPVLVAYGIAYCLLFWPWCLAWFLFGPLWSLCWAWRALRRRAARRI